MKLIITFICLGLITSAQVFSNEPFKEEGKLVSYQGFQDNQITETLRELSSLFDQCLKEGKIKIVQDKDRWKPDSVAGVACEGRAAEVLWMSLRPLIGNNNFKIKGQSQDNKSIVTFSSKTRHDDLFIQQSHCSNENQIDYQCFIGLNIGYATSKQLKEKEKSLIDACLKQKDSKMAWRHRDNLASIAQVECYGEAAKELTEFSSNRSKGKKFELGDKNQALGHFFPLNISTRYKWATTDIMAASSSHCQKRFQTPDSDLAAYVCALNLKVDSTLATFVGIEVERNTQALASSHDAWLANIFHSHSIQSLVEKNLTKKKKRGQRNFGDYIHAVYY